MNQNDLENLKITGEMQAPTANFPNKKKEEDIAVGIHNILKFDGPPISPVKNYDNLKWNVKIYVASKKHKRRKKK